MESVTQFLTEISVSFRLITRERSSCARDIRAILFKGYKCYTQILNAKDYGVAQNRERCFMVSILGDYNYKFPQPVPLDKTMKDYLEDEVDEKYYINSEKAQKLIKDLRESGQLDGISKTVRGAEAQ